VALDGTTPVSVGRVDALLDATSWDTTWVAMQHLLDELITQRRPPPE
jgi:hypothetical protein